MKKVAIIGAGNVGATTAYFVAKERIADVVLLDVVEGMPQSKAEDFLHAGPLERYNVEITGSTNYEAMRDADVVVHTAGIPRKPGMDRLDLMKTNAGIAKTAGQAIGEFAPNAVVIVVANPLDIIALAILRETGFALRHIVGMAGILDSTRFSYFIAQELGVKPEDVSSMVLGGHGDSMVPLSRYTSVGGFPLTELLDAETIERLVQRTRIGGGEIVNYLKKGSAFYAPGASVAQMVAAVIMDRKRVVAASAYLRGEYGHRGIFFGVPVILGKNGVERIIELELTEEERAALDLSAEQVREAANNLDELLA